MKLFLTSGALNESLIGQFEKFMGKPLSQVSIALIENASDVYESEPEWVTAHREQLQGLVRKVDVIDLRDFYGLLSILKAELSQSDIIWVGGGNTFYLRKILKETQADEIILEIVQKGMAYGGSSAGTIITGPTLSYLELVDSIDGIKPVYRDGLNLIEQVVIPHKDNEDVGGEINEIDFLLTADGYNTICIDDNQAVIIRDKDVEVVS